MTSDELREEVRAIADLNQRLAERIETFTRRLYRHFDLPPGGGKTDFRLLGPDIVRKVTPYRTRDDEDDFGGD